jgi:RimJ/RimL family protein N-acetyltransferase
VSVALQAPKVPLTDGAICLRLPGPADVAALVEYTATPGWLEGVWLPVQPGTRRERLEWIVEGWLRGWAGCQSHDGPALLLDLRGTSRFVGYVGFGARDEGVVELVYGIAPDWRGRGLATRATILATRWLVAARGVSAVELRIARDHHASRRVAEKAGFLLAGTIRQVAAVTEAYEDLRYVYTVGRGPARVL